jgi:signal peptidase I
MLERSLQFPIKPGVVAAWNASTVVIVAFLDGSSTRVRNVATGEQHDTPLEEGDFIFVNKFSYGLRLPILNSKFLSTGQPQRGDVVVFRLPADPSVHYIKRLIGLPGDHVVVRDNTIFINGARVPAKRDGEYSGGYGFSGADLEVEQLGDRDHLIMLAKNRMSTDYDSVVPPGNYFFMGDNRNDSEDGRFAQVGFVPDKNLDGRAMLIWMNWQIPGWPIWHRFGTKIS